VRIAFLDDYTDSVRSLESFAKLAGHDVTVETEHVADVDELARRLAGVEVVALNRERTRITADLLNRLPDLRLLSASGGYPHIDVDACTERGVLLSVGSRETGPSWETAELAWALILASARRLPQQVAAARDGRWQTEIGTTLHGRTLGVLGYGGLGQVVAGYGRAFGMRVVVWSGESSRRAAADDGYEIAPDQRGLFAAADFLSVHVRLNDATRGLIGADDLAAMRPTATFVNTSRAGLVQPGALEAALAAGRPAHAAVDVYDIEPVTDPEHPLLSRDDLIGTPHIGYVTREGYDVLFGLIVDQILAYGRGQPVNVINPGVRR
jgi:D-3-phosphoglycerate dehydrogenase